MRPARPRAPTRTPIRRTPRGLVAVVVLAGVPLAGLGLSGCGSSPATTSAADLAMVAAPDLAGGACPTRDVSCTDNQILDLALLKLASKRAITNAADGAGFLTTVDATAGGFTPTESFVYASFTASGLTPVRVGDEAALASGDWDIAFRRYVVRLNSGVSGPSCVTGAAVPGDYDTLATAPQGLSLSDEAYYDGSCKLIDDGSGLPGSPGTVLHGYWSYSGCVQMTGQVYVVSLADGRKVKLTVTAYYGGVAGAQATCDMSGQAPNGAVGGKLELRWAFLP